jgi:predicted ATPase
MKLTAFQMINCFGFRDSGSINLNSPHNFIYLLGRNSSGKSSVLNALKYFEWGITPFQQPNFTNFNDSGAQPALVGTFKVSKSEVSEEKYRARLTKKFADLMIDQAAMSQDPRLRKIFDVVVKIYADLIARINTAEEIVVWKTLNGHHEYREKDSDEHAVRKKQISAVIDAARSREGHFNVSGTLRNVDLTWNTVEDLLFLQAPNIYLFNEKFSLREVLPERIDSNWESSKSKFSATFIEYLGKKNVNKYLNSNDPEEREELLSELRGKVKNLTDKVNQSKSGSPNTDLLEITLHDKNGIQITVRTDGKKSYYAHLSDNTKFLFAYYLYQETNDISDDILLFDEPSNGFHPTAQTFILNFLQQLAAGGNLVIVATHSEHLIDLDFLSDVRLMSTDGAKNIIVRNHFYNQAKDKGDYLALQPILDAIGYRHGNQLNIKDKVIVTEGVTDLLYLRAFNKILGFTDDIDIAPARGDGTILNIVPLLVSQGINFKIVIDTGSVKQKIQSTFGIEEKFIYEVPIPPDYVGKMTGSGIEDLFSKTDFEARLVAIGHTPTADFKHVSNSHYIKPSPAKRLTAQRFYEMASSFSESDFEVSTIESFRQVLAFCKNSQWYSL